MTALFVGIDVSKGYADFCCVNLAGSIVGGLGRFDDTASGHEQVSHWVDNLRMKAPGSEMSFGLENSGGLERNWAVFLKRYVSPFGSKVFTLNPLAVKKFLDSSLHRNITDEISAQGIAHYLRRGIRTTEVPFEDTLSGPISLYRCLRNAISRSAQVKNELQSLLPRVQPELVQFCRTGFRTWTLQLLQQWPTAAKLAKAKSAQVAEIPYISEAKAVQLIAAAKESVAAENDAFSEMSVEFLVKDILHCQEMIKSMKDKVIESLTDDEGATIIQSIPGIGAWGAACLRLEIGSIERFHSPEALVAFAGLDPRIKQSGDSTKQTGISRRGRRQIRAILYPLIMAAIRHNPVITDFYTRLRTKGKGHLVSATACMRKMLHIIYGCWVSGKKFDLQYEKRRKLEKPAPIEAQADAPAVTPTPIQTPILNPQKTPEIRITAPVSRREASKRRKAVAMPQTSITRRERGPGTASKSNAT